MAKRIIHIKVLEHRETGLLMALSDDLRGLVVHARTEQELNDKMPGAIKDLLEAAGCRVDSVEPLNEEIDGFKVKSPPAFVANSHLAAAE